MSDLLHFVVPGLPQPKERPRVQRRDRDGRLLREPRIYTPKRTQTYEKSVGWAALSAVRRARLGVPLLGWLELEIDLYLETRGLADGDNVAKAIADALQKAGILENDRQVTDWTIRVRPATSLVVGGAPCASVFLRAAPFAGDFR